MRTALRHGVACCMLLTLGHATATMTLLESASAQGSQEQVLVLYATRRDAQIAVVGDRVLPQMLELGLGRGIDYYSEFIDLARFAQPDYYNAFSSFLEVKYQGKRFDAVIAMGDTPLTFVDKARERLFPDTPIVFFSSQTSRLPRMSNATGVVAPLNLTDTLTLATALQPHVRNVFVVSGSAASNKAIAAAALEQLQPFEGRLLISYLSGLDTEELESRLTSLPQHSIVYYLLVNRGGGGEHYDPLAYVDRLTALSNAPVYSWVDSAMGRGIVGGSLKNQAGQARAVGELALRVLRGEDAGKIPVVTLDLNVPQVDWRELRRWRIPESRVPPGTRIEFRDSSAWERYRPFIFGLVAVLLAQGLLIAALLVQRGRRRQAEAQVRGGQAALVHSYERIRDLGGRLLSAQETERARVARELHDDISQQMALLEINLSMLAGQVDDHAQRLAGEAMDRADAIAKSVHDLSHRLHPAKLTLIGLVASLHGLRRELSSSGVPITFTHSNVPSALAPELTLCLYRIVQEALQNALKYSGARSISVHLHGIPPGLALNIIDDGVGFDVATAGWRKGLGLISMYERVEAAGGTLAIHSAPGAGTRLEVRVPVREIDETDPVAV